LREDIRLWLELGEGLGRVEEDPLMIEQVLLNLLVNARDALPRGGEVAIRTSLQHVDPARALEDEVLSAGDYLAIEVSDSGPGIPDALRDRVFEPLFTTKPFGLGSGLGLSTARSIVRRSGGDVRLNPPGDAGAAFVVLLPRAEEHRGTDSIRPSAAPAAGGSETILLVEDDPMILRATAQILSLAGYSVLSSGNPRGALDLAEKAQAIHLLLTDLVMPGQSGRELAWALRARLPDLSVVFMTAYSDDYAPGSALLDGWPVLRKPIPTDHLFRTVRDCLDTHSSTIGTGSADGS
jgi:CheY-like chemotaxis protein